jgi:hypothetical protein
MRIQSLLFKAETLNFIEILASFKMNPIVRAYAISIEQYCSICGIRVCVECESSPSQSNLLKFCIP